MEQEDSGIVVNHAERSVFKGFRSFGRHEILVAVRITSSRSKLEVNVA